MAQTKRNSFTNFLYYSDTDEKELADAIEERHFLFMVPIFGFAKVIPQLGNGSEGITSQEIEAEISKYSEFNQNFDYAEAAESLLDYAVVLNGTEANLKNMDKWYQRDKGETVGAFTLYRLTLKPKEN